MDSIINTKTEKEFLFKIFILFFSESERSIKQNKSFNLAISGGETPKKVFSFLINNFQNKMQWKYFNFYWVDERCVHPSDSKSNFKHANDILLSKISEIGSVNRIYSEINKEKAAKIAARKRN